MKRISVKRKISLAVSAVMIASVLSSCGGDSSSGEADTTASVQTQASEASVTSAVSLTDDFFGEDYDPFADDYDPYGGNGASAAKHNPETGAAADNITDDTIGAPAETEAVRTEQTTNAPAETKAANGGNAVTAKQTEAPRNESSDKGRETAAKSAEKSSSDVTLTLNSSNGWENGSDKFTQIDGTVKNGSSTAIGGWTVTIPAASGVKVDQKWNCEISVSGGTLTVTPVDYNSNIDPGSEGTFGMILCNSGTIDN
ncbi:MAG: cellulose binding domain-containing protein, partial [Oscillospiraceae bacterium]|nr:cellulose binding domain-containing protein [Oscillospiraceae bacterium]